jgi:hypothetical protein
MKASDFPTTLSLEIGQAFSSTLFDWKEPPEKIELGEPLERLPANFGEVTPPARIGRKYELFVAARGVATAQAVA